MNKVFEKMLKLSVQPFQSVREQAEQAKSDGYTDKKTRSRKTVNASEKRSDTSR